MKNILIVMILITASVLVIAQTKNKGDEQKTQVKRETTYMREHSTATFTLSSWDEKPYNEMQGVPKLTRISATKSYQGGITGEGRLEYLMMYRDDGSAIFTGLERVVGTIGGRSGSFLLHHSGTFERGVAKVTLSIVTGSGTGRLRGMKGEGEFAVGHQQPYDMTLDYGFE